MCTLFPLVVTKDGRIEPLQMLGVYALLWGGILLAILTMLGENWWKRKVKDKADRMKHRLRR